MQPLEPLLLSDRHSFISQRLRFLCAFRSDSPAVHSMPTFGSSSDREFVLPAVGEARRIVGLILAILTAALLCSCLVAEAAPAPANLIANVPARTTISLSGVWHAIVDPYETGLSDRFYENRKPKDKQDLVEYDFDASGTLKVPGDWNSQRDSLLFYEGPVWYERSFSYQKHPHTRTFIYFGAANYQAHVYLNGESLGEHEGGFTPFNFEISDGVRDGDNFVVVE